MRFQKALMVGSLCSGACVFNCQRAADPVPATPAAPAASVTPMASPGATAAAPAKDSAANQSTASTAPGGYPICGGQRLANASGVSRSGPVTVQLAPAFLDQMPACGASDAFPKDKVAKATGGTINAKGDCELASIGVTCHYHSGSEFVSSTATKQTPGQGELHCIFPSDDPKSPRVYGGHVTCRDKTKGEPHGHHASHEVHQGAACAPGLLQQLEQCQSFRCCDDGTLTNPIQDLSRDGRNDIRPDFRICEKNIELDCELLATLTAHDANSPALGGVGEPAFAVAAPDKAKEGPANAKGAPAKGTSEVKAAAKPHSP